MFQLFGDALGVCGDSMGQRQPEPAEKAGQHSAENAPPFVGEIDHVLDVHLPDLAQSHRQLGRHHIGRPQAAGDYRGAGDLDLRGAHPLRRQLAGGDVGRVDVRSGQGAAGDGPGVHNALTGDVAGMDFVLHDQSAVIDDILADQRFIVQDFSFRNVEIFHRDNSFL